MKDILVIGESCLDVFVYCEAKRLAPDFPVPILNELYKVENGGMAKNVHNNISVKVECDIHTNPNWTDITKTRYIHDNTNYMFMRVDSRDTIPRINLNELDLDYKIIVISDYNKGFLKESDIEYITSKNDNVFLDTKKILGSWAEGCRYIKINDFEFNNSRYALTPLLESKLIHTKGSEGCFFQDVRYTVEPVEVKDLTGAGDSFISGLVVEYLKSGDIIRSIKYANICASEVVKHRGITLIK